MSNTKYNNMMTIKEYARTRKVSLQNIYAKINRPKNKDFFEQHSEIINGSKYLDVAAVEKLDSMAQQNSLVVVSADEREHLEELKEELESVKKENDELRQKMFDMNEKYIAHLIEQNNRIMELSNRVVLLTDQQAEKEKENEVKKGFRLFRKKNK